MASFHFVHPMAVEFRPNGATIEKYATHEDAMQRWNDLRYMVDGLRVYQRGVWIVRYEDSK